jgi:hypothetical protein
MLIAETMIFQQFGTAVCAKSSILRQADNYLNMIRKGQVKRLAGSAARGQVKFVVVFYERGVSRKNFAPVGDLGTFLRQPALNLALWNVTIP